MRSEIPLLTKRDYLEGLGCEKRLYLRKYHAALGAEVSPGVQSRMDDGREIGEIARDLFQGGVLVASKDVAEACTATQIFMGEAHTIFEGSFVYDGLVARADVLNRVGDGWALFEAKSSKEPKPDEGLKPGHVMDLAFQLYVLRRAGVNVKTAGLILLSRDYVSGPEGGYDVRKLFKILDATEEATKRLPDIQVLSQLHKRILSAENPPTVETTTYCRECQFFEHCFPDLASDHLFFFPRVTAEIYSMWKKEGVRVIGDIPDNPRFKGTQKYALAAHAGRRPFVSSELRDELSGIEYPLHLIDFETTKWVAPVLPGTSAHMAIPFQWSCHVLEGPSAEPVHREFLFRGTGDPRAEFVSSLLKCLRPAATIGTYTGYERSRVEELARDGFDGAKELLSILKPRELDLKKLVEEHVYHAEFRGSLSLKAVLPALCPGAGYEDLRIQDGESASVEYKRMISPKTDPAEAEAIARDLLAYCKRDTEAMVFLLAALRGLVPGGAAVVMERPLPDDSVHEQLALNI